LLTPAGLAICFLGGLAPKVVKTKLTQSVKLLVQAQWRLTLRPPALTNALEEVFYLIDT
jgi:hypothetical protein